MWRSMPAETYGEYESADRRKSSLSTQQPGCTVALTAQTPFLPADEIVYGTTIKKPTSRSVAPIKTTGGKYIFPALTYNVAALEHGTRHYPQEFEIIQPKVFHNDNEIPTSLLHVRQRRSVPGVSHDPVLPTSINISTLYGDLHIQLIPNTQLLAPGFRIYHTHSDSGSEMTRDDVAESDVVNMSSCLYRGHIASHNASAAISLCRGVTGVLMFPDEDYVIEPLPAHLRSIHHQGNHYHDNNQPHIMYRRSALPQHRFDNYEAYSGINRHVRSPESFHRTRRKRHANHDRHERSVETLVVVDKAMYASHGRENITTYVLSIFNIVSQMYQDRSLGYTINIVLVGLVFLDGRERGLEISHHADKTLNSFCQWQAAVKGARRKQHDVAVLLTGIDICSYRDAPCDTLGFAPIEGMCSEVRSCIVNEDTGLSTAFTITHEIGHNFGMFHDGDGNSCRETAGNIMSATLTARSGIFHWSSCSRHYMRKFLNTVQSECLTNQVHDTAELKFPDKLPGEIFDADTQCKWQFGSHSKQCTFFFGRDPCENLWCYKRSSMCETKFLPAAEGTSCGRGMWCRHGRCSRYEGPGPSPVAGQWAGWSDWSQCSRSCGGGVKSRKRECSNPRPQYGGKSCDGKSMMDKMCNLPECEVSEGDYREAQCEAHSRHQFPGGYYRWRAFREQQPTDVEDQCKLYCKADGYNFYYAMSREVTDGTPCNKYNTDICVHGKCQSVGCDLMVGSSARKDKCGACKGDNSTCKVVENTFTSQPKKNTYSPVAVIPRGASSIVVRELGMAPHNYLVLRDALGQYHLNGAWHLTREGIYKFAGTQFVYSRSYNRAESLTADGPLTEDLILEVLVQAENPGIRYSFTVPTVSNELPPPQHNHSWSVILTDCSQPCATGRQTVTVHCHRDHKDEVDPAYCSQDHRPTTGSYPCNTDPCQPRWVTEPWGVCRKPCGGGKQRRRVYCLQKLSQTEDKRVPRRSCDQASKPAKKRECNTHECPPVWYKGTWSKCSVTCGGGVKMRDLVCRSKTSGGHAVLPDSMCSQVPQPKSQKRCRNRRCPNPTARWNIRAWSQCVGSCNEGIRSRTVQCTQRDKRGKVHLVRDSHCHHLPRHNVSLHMPCSLEPCGGDIDTPVCLEPCGGDIDTPVWYSSPWSQCSASCGWGHHTRLVHCVYQQEHKLASDCDVDNKPQESQICHVTDCPSPDVACVDEFSWCHLVPKHNICHHSFYGTKCCASCLQPR